MGKNRTNQSEIHQIQEKTGVFPAAIRRILNRHPHVGRETGAKGLRTEPRTDLRIRPEKFSLIAFAPAISLEYMHSETIMVRHGFDEPDRGAAKTLIQTVLYPENGKKLSGMQNLSDHPIRRCFCAPSQKCKGKTSCSN